MGENIHIEKAIVHILNQKISLFLSDAILELDNDILKLISNHITNAYENQGRVFAKFKSSDNVVRIATIDIFSDDTNFIEKSKSIARKLYSAMAKKNASPANLLIVEYLNGEKKSLAIIKLDFSENFHTEKIEKNGITTVKLKVTKDGFNKNDKLRKCAIIDEDIIDDVEAKILVLDTQNKEEISDYFRDDFLDTDLINNNKMNTTNMIRELLSYINEKYKDDEKQMIEKTFQLTTLLNEKDEFKIDEALPAIFYEKETQDSFKERVRDKGIDFTFRLHRDTVVKRLKNRTIVTGNGISLKGKASLFNTNDIEINDREDGLCDIIIKGVKIEKNKL
ncbi:MULTISPECIES: nucleoid-associated protein [Clostridium]|uniref:Nucleoid-associated protein n=1 Tax=Clostridium disporicum TaxID=84024 RepID=A0A174HML6_9CLOT|nr:MULTISPECIES: nucleoid-associated protein [Clostridium]CUO74716.1 nucleoid-associated protein [Clostridium disporicum]